MLNALGAELANPPCRRLPLRLVVRDHAAEGSLAALLLEVGNLLGAEVRADEVDGRARGRDLEQRRLVGDRYGGSGSARLEVADVGDRGRVLGRLAGVGADLGGAPAGTRAAAGCVVEVDGADPEPADVPARSIQRHARAVGDVLPVGAAGPAERHADVDVHRALARLDRGVARTAAHRKGQTREARDQTGSDRVRAHPKKGAASSYSASGTVRSSATASLSGTSSILVPRSAAIVPQRPS